MRRHVSYSELSAYRQCPFKWQLSYRDGWKPAEAAAPLTKGRLFHEMLALHYQLLKENPGSLTATDLAAVNADMFPAADDEITQLCRWMYEGYLDCYGTDPGWTVIAVEQRDSFPLVTAAGTKSTINMVTVLDLLVADELGRVWLVDHKTGGRFPTEVGLDLDDQFTLYQWGLHQRGIEVHGVLYNFCRTQRNKGPMKLEERFGRIPMYRTSEQLANTALDAWQTARRMFAGPYVERATDPEMCIRKCPFTEPCLFGRKGGRIEEFLVSQGYVRGNDRGNEGGKAA